MAISLMDAKRAFFVNKGLAGVDNRTQINQMELAYLRSELPGVGGSKVDLLRRWLRDKGFAGTVQDMYREFLISQGFGQYGSMDEMLKRYYQSMADTNPDWYDNAVWNDGDGWYDGVDLNPPHYVPLFEGKRVDIPVWTPTTPEFLIKGKFKFSQNDMGNNVNLLSDDDTNTVRVAKTAIDKFQIAYMSSTGTQVYFLFTPDVVLVDTGYEFVAYQGLTGNLNLELKDLDGNILSSRTSSLADPSLFNINRLGPNHQLFRTLDGSLWDVGLHDEAAISNSRQYKLDEASGTVATDSINGEDGVWDIEPTRVTI